MKVFILLALFAASQASVLAPALISTGASNQYRSEDNLGNYAFGYNEGHLSGGSFRKESGDVHGNKYGSYGLRDADGRVRIVNYVADADGFRADIKTNEPGVEPKDPASTLINKAGLVVAAPTVHHAVAYSAPVAVAPVAHAAPLAVAPVSYSAPVAVAPAVHYAYAPRPIAYASRPIAYASRPIAYASQPIAYASRPIAYAHEAPISKHYGFYPL